MMMYSKSFFDTMCEKLCTVEVKALFARTCKSAITLYPETLTGYILSPEVKEVAKFGFLPNDRPVKTC